MKVQRNWSFCAAIAAALCFCASPLPAAQVSIFQENFDVLVPFLGPAFDESIDPAIVGWTSHPPDDWSVDRTGVPSIGIPAQGMTEWEGWSFVSPEFWLAADGQLREEFTKGTGVIAVADPDEWDDLGDPESLGSYNTHLFTPTITLPPLLIGGTLELTFDSSWRPETDNFDQTAIIHVSYDGGAETEVLRWTSSAGPNFHPDNTNETVTVALANPAGATEAQISFGLINAGNDWWWAIDNVRVNGELIPEPSSISLLLLWGTLAAALALRRRR